MPSKQHENSALNTTKQNDYRIAGPRLVGTNGEKGMLIQCDENGNLRIGGAMYPEKDIYYSGDFLRCISTLYAYEGDTFKQLNAVKGALKITDQTERKILSASTLVIEDTENYNPPTGAKTIILSASPSNTKHIKYGTTEHGCHIYLKAGDTIELPATNLSFESTVVSEVGIMVYG